MTSVRLASIRLASIRLASIRSASTAASIITNTVINTPSRAFATQQTQITSGVYFIAEIPFNGKVKIGRSKNIFRRRRQLQSCNPNLLGVLCHIPTNNMVALEGQLHRKFSNYRIRGEWFDLSMCQILSEYRGHMGF